MHAFFEKETEAQNEFEHRTQEGLTF